MRRFPHQRARATNGRRQRRPAYTDVDLPALILKSMTEPMTRNELVVRIIRDEFGRFGGAEMRRGISALLKINQLESKSGKKRINDNEVVYKPDSLF